jgi:hypothetical protein
VKHRHIWVWGIATAATCVSVFAATKPGNDYGRLPLTFEANAGQTDQRVKYLSRGAGYTLFLTSGNEAVVSLARTTPEGERQTAAVRMTMVGGKSAESVHALDPQTTVSNYFYGSDSKRWLKNVRHYGRISYQGVYPGIDVVYYGNQRQLEYDFVVAPGADPSVIRLKFDGAQSVTADKNGDLVLQTRYGQLRQLKPVVYQDIDGVRRYVAANYTIREGNQAGFSLGEYDRSAKLVIDPILAYSTFLGGTGVESGYGIAVDAGQSVYVVGSTASSDFPVSSGLSGQTLYRGGASDAFVVKYNPAGNSIAFSTYLGGSGADSATVVGVDTAGNIIVGGNTDSANFPTRNPLQPIIGGKHDAFLLKIGTAGLIYSTFLGGFEDDQAFGLAIQGENAVVCGMTRSTNFWASGGLQPAYMGGITDGWVFKMDAVGQRIWSTYLGGGGDDAANDVAVDTAGNVYVTGSTSSLGFPTTAGAYQPVIRGRSPFLADAFVTKIKGDDGKQFLYSTYLGGTAFDEGTGIAVHTDGTAYVTGDTESVDFPTLNPLQGPPGNRDVFVTKVNPAGTALLFSTYLAGSSVDTAAAIGLDPIGNAYILGTTTSDNFPVGNPIQATRQGSNDLFVAKIDANGTSRVWVTYLGGSSDDIASGLAVDASSNIYLTGTTISANFPHLVSHQPALSGAQDAFLTKIAGCDISVTPAGAAYGPNTVLGSFTVNAFNCPWVASSSDPWIVVTNAASGLNSGTVTYTVESNPGIARTGTISVSGVRYTITQSGLTTVAPSVVSLTPNAGSGTSQLFTSRYATANPGGATIERTYLLMNTIINGTGGCLVEYSPGSNMFRLINDDGATWSLPAVAGTSVVLSNSQCSLNVGQSSGGTVLGVGTLETVVNTSLSFTGAFAGAKNIYLLGASESSGLTSGWIQAGTWTVTTGGGPVGGVGVSSLAPLNGNSYAQTFTGTFTHSGGANQHYLGYILFLPTPNIVNYTATGSCLVEYNRISNGMRLIDNAGTGWLGGISGVPLGSVGQTLANNYCSVNVQNASAVVSGTTMTVSVPVTFQPTLGPVLGTFLQALDVNGIWTGMTQFGNWVLPGAVAQRTGPGIVGIDPTNATGSGVTYSVTASHQNGVASLAQIHLLLSDRIVGGLPCHVIYFPGTNQLNLVNDAGTALVSPTGVTPGTSGFLSNSRCAVNTVGSSIGVSGNNITVTTPLTFQTAIFGGSKGVYGNAFDNGGLTTHWVQGATLFVQ